MIKDDLHVGMLYFIQILDKNRVKIVPKGQSHRVYRMLEYHFSENALDLTLKRIKCCFEMNSDGLYCLKSIEPFKMKKVKEKEKDSKIKKTFQDKKNERVRNYFYTHFDELMEVKRACRIENVTLLDEIRIEIRRLMHYGDMYQLERKDLADILRDFGFVIKDY